MNSKISGYNNPTTANINTNSASSINQTGSQAMGFTKGEIVKGEVIDQKGNEVSVALEDGRQLTGKLVEHQLLSIGDRVSFQVEDVTSRMLNLKLLSTNQQATMSMTLEKALYAANLSKNQKNIAIVEELLHNKMPIDKNTLLKLIQQSNIYGEDNVKTLVLMNKLNIPVNAGNIEQFNRYTEGGQNLINDLSNLSDSIVQLFKDIASGSGISEEAVGESIPFDSLFNVILEEKETGTPMTFNPASENSTTTFSTVDNAVKTPSPLPLPDEETIQESEKTLQHTKTAPALDIKNNYPNNNGYIHHVLNTEERESLLQNLLKPPLGDNISEEMKNQLIKGTLTTKELLTFIKENINNLPKEVLKDLVSSKEFKSLVKNHLELKWTLPPIETGSKEKLQEHISHLAKQSEDVEKLAAKFYQNPADFQQGTAAKNNLNFVQHLQQIFHYIPIPLRLKEQVTNGELFVYKNKASRQSLEEGIKVLLHLDMEHLGSTDIFIEMKQKNITCNFYFDREDSVSFLLPYIPELEYSIEKIGYSIKATVEKKEQDTNPVEEFIKEERDKDGIERYNFDMRA